VTDKWAYTFSLIQNKKKIDICGDRVETERNHGMGGKRIKCNNKVGF